jgi:hypothetical protein
MTGQQNYTPGEIIEYTSFDPSGYSRAEVIRYAPASEQWLICPNCDQQAVPAPGRHHGFQACPRCRAFVRWPDLPPLLYVRGVTRPRCSPFLVRESQTRRPHEQEARPA